MLESLVQNMLKQGAGADEVIGKAIELSREAFQKLTSLERTLDQNLGSEFRRQVIDPLLAKERQIDSIRARVSRGGKFRTGDKLQALLGRSVREYEQLDSSFPWTQMQLANRRLVKSYIEERRNHLQLGDAERVRNTYLDAMNEQSIAV